MALFTKQDFTPPILSRKWIAIKFRQNMLLYSRHHIISILESGLLFREDSAEVEQEAPSAEDVWVAAGGGRGGWFTAGEGVAATVAVAAAVFAFPPRSLDRSAMLKVAGYVALPVALRASHRALCRGSLASLLANMRDYLALARRTAACLKEFAALHAQLDSISSVIESTQMMLCRQQSELSIVMSRASSALLGNTPWLRADLAWDAVARDRTDNLMKIHHAFLVVQSTLLKHVAMAHYTPSPKAQKLYRNHNERIYWIHSVIIVHLNEEFKQNYDSLERMYRLLKNSGSKDVAVSRKLGTAVNDSWLYSDVHTGIARACLELKLALNKTSGLDVFLDSCALNRQEVDLNVLNKDIDDLIDDVTKCLTTVQNSQLRLKKLKSKFVKEPDTAEKKHADVVEDAVISKIEDREPETKDEVFYFIRTDDDDVSIQPAGDLTTAPGKKERETTKVVLTELKRKLGKREDVMRERERQALAKTMPEYKNNLPEFPRQIKFDEFIEKKGYIQKLTNKCRPKRRVFRHYRIESKQSNKKIKKYKLKLDKYERDKEINGEIYEANAYLNFKSKLLISSPGVIIQWCKCVSMGTENKEVDSSGMSEGGASDVEAGTANKTINQAVNSHEKIIKFTKRDLELSNSSSESIVEYNTEEQQALLNDIRRHRLVRKKNQPRHRAAVGNGDDSLRPIEYSFGTGLAMASVLQTNNNAKLPNMAREEVFIGDGEVSDDSGNDDA